MYAACTATEATEYEYCDVVRLLIARGADVNAFFPGGGETGRVLHHTCRLGKVHRTRTLLDHGANPVLKDRAGRTAFDAFDVPWNPKLPEVRKLLRKYVAIHVRTCVLGKHPRRDRLRDLVPRVASYVV